MEVVENGYGKWLVLHEVEERTSDRRRQYCFKNIETEEVKVTTIRQLKKMKPYDWRVHGKTRTPTYSSWCAMKGRCLNPNNHKYKDYGGRGITVCNEWVNSFESFLADMGEKPFGLSIDRLDVNGPYCKSNCKWSTPKEQANNKRRINRYG